MNLTAIILAAGQGTRMKSKIPKVLHKVTGKTMLKCVVDVLDNVNVTKKVVIVGHGREEVKNSLEGSDVLFAVQEEILGTGHAVMMAKDMIGDEDHVLILCGDTPLLKSETIKSFIDFYKNSKSDAAVLTAHFDNPFGYGRIVKGNDNSVLAIVEQKDASEEIREIKEINSGIYMFSGKLLKDSLDKLGIDNVQGEYYLTDVIKIANEAASNVQAYMIEDNDELLGVNSRVQLYEAEIIMKKRLINEHQINGVTFLNTDSVYIEQNVVIGNDTVIYPGSYLSGNTVIASDCEIGPDAKIHNCIVSEGAKIFSSTITDSSVGKNTAIGPYAYLRPNSNIGENVKIGDFVEVKNANIGNNSKVSHLSYIGDGDIGDNVNVGCGVIFVNYNGVSKSRTVIEDNAFIGCNSNLVSPVVIGEGAYIAAGSTITKDVPAKALAVARSRQVNKEGWIEKSGLFKK
ncbi:MAG: bifunctional UDP-N-acetylglucosamine diphosphorylase/glucosamine-1-phosphate N-acetyltransferase GlmU [Acidaminobacteraceae bacterium]